MLRYVVKLSDNVSYTINVEDADECLAKFQEESNLKFTLAYEDDNFGKIDVLSKKRTLLWSDNQCLELNRGSMPFDGVPFFVLGKKVFCCGVKNRGIKRKANEQSSCGFTCPAKVSIFEIIKFPHHVIKEDEPTARANLLKKLKADLSVGKALAERRFYVFFPKLSEHRLHLVLKDGHHIQPESLCVQEEEEDVEVNGGLDISVSDPEITSVVHSAQHCVDMLEAIRSKTFSLDEVTLAYGRIVLKDVLLRLKSSNKNTFVNSSASSER